MSTERPASSAAPLSPDRRPAPAPRRSPLPRLAGLARLAPLLGSAMLWTGVLATGALALACAPAGTEPGSGVADVAEVTGDLAIVGVTVLPMTGEERLPGHTVVVDDGRIVKVAPADSVRVAGETRIVDGAGKFLMPGIAEMHGHYPQDAEGQLARDILYLYVANGVTLVRGMQGGPQHLPLRDAIARGEVLGPRLLVSAPMLHGGATPDPEQAERLVREAAAAGFDHLKVHEELSPEVYDRIAATAKEVGLPFSGHVSNRVGLYHALERGQQTIDHLDNYLEAMIGDPETVAELGLFDLGRHAAEIDESRIGEVVAATVEAGAGVVPTMELWEVLFGSQSGEQWLAQRPEARYMPRQMVDGWVTGTDQRVEQFGQDPQAIANILELRRRVLDALHQAGAPVLLGTDSPQIFSVPGFSVHHEMEAMVEAGLTPREVLASGTSAVADFLGLDDFGRVAEGGRADLVLLDADPTVDVANFSKPSGVVVAGRWIGAEEIAAELEAIAARAAGG